MTAAHAAIVARLEPGESLLWSQAAPAADLVAHSAPMLAFVVLFNLVVWWAFIAVLRFPRDKLTPADRARRPYGVGFALLFVVGGLIGLYVTTVGFASSWSTSYGLTDRRVIIASEFPFRVTRSYDASAFATMAADRGTLEFAYRRQKGHDYNARLHGVADPPALAQRIRETLHAERAPDSPD